MNVKEIKKLPLELRPTSSDGICPVCSKAMKGLVVKKTPSANEWYCENCDLSLRPASV